MRSGLFGKHDLWLRTQWCFHCSHIFLSTHPTNPPYRDEAILQLQAGHGSSHFRYLGISKNGGPPKSCILRGCSITSHSFLGRPHLWKPSLLKRSFFSGQACWAPSWSTARLPAMMPHGARDVGQQLATDLSMDWFHGHSTGNHCFFHQKYGGLLQNFPSTNSGILGSSWIFLRK